LIRAYGDCAQLALDQVDIKERIQLSTLELEIPYELIGWVINLVEGFGGVVKSGIYDAHVRLVLEIPAVNLEALRAALTEKGGGKVRIS
jgi:putative IMPACT (imprinted ancient) family translation regulator